MTFSMQARSDPQHLVLLNSVSWHPQPPQNFRVIGRLFPNPVDQQSHREAPFVFFEHYFLAILFKLQNDCTFAFRSSSD